MKKIRNSNSTSTTDATKSLLRRYIAYLRLEKGMSPNTIEAYIDDINKLIDFLAQDNLAWHEVTHLRLHDFVCTLQDIGITPRSQARILSGIKSFFRFLLQEGYISDNPTTLIDQPQLGQHLPEVLTLQEVNSMIASVDLTAAEGQRNRTILEVLYSCGLRVSELVNLKLSQLFLDDEYISIEGKGNKQRLVPISPQAIYEIQQYLPQRARLDIKPDEEDYLFLNRRGKHLSRIMVFYIVRDACLRCDIKKTISPHTLRHSFATHMLENGANLRAIQQMLGHESITTTEVYVHLNKQFLRQEIIKYHPRNKQNSKR